ncbi:MAG: hypothetical protein QJR07_14775 [Acetobacteraceae bacterium]|nr:hypothetical protein [Acetobacteraceae bacterium]
MTDRVLTLEERALKTLTRKLIDGVGGIDAAASCTNVGRSQIANYQSLISDQFIRIDVLNQLERVAQNSDRW